MSSRVLTAIATLFLATLLSVAFTPSLSHAGVGVTVQDFEFVPRDLVISAGETVTWTWSDGFHSTTSGADSNDPNAGSLWDYWLFSGQKTYAYEFTTPGYYPYFCRVHDALNMRGSVTVLRPHALARYKVSTETEPTSWGVIKSLYR